MGFVRMSEGLEWAGVTDGERWALLFCKSPVYYEVFKECGTLMAKRSLFGSEAVSHVPLFK